MIEVRVCVGSSCHIRGGAKTLKIFRSLIESHSLEKRVSLAAELCVENCISAPNVMVSGESYGGITPDAAEKFFQERILSVVDEG